LVATATKEGVRKEPCGVVMRVTRAALREDWCSTSWRKKGLARKAAGGKEEGGGAPA
jgi:hypothetical protein